MKALLILLPFAVVVHNLIRAWQKREQSALFFLTLACTVILLCVAIFTSAVFLGHGQAIAMLRGIAPGQASLKALLGAVCVAMGTVAVCQRILPVPQTKRMVNRTPAEHGIGDL
jgi:hypothetical protein